MTAVGVDNIFVDSNKDKKTPKKTFGVIPPLYCHLATIEEDVRTTSQH